MTTPVFPTYPTLLLQGHNYTPQVALQRILYDDGSVRQARLTTRVTIHRNVEYTLCGANQLESFKRWWYNDLVQGSRYFLWKDPLSERVGDSSYSYGRFFEGRVEYIASEPTMDLWIARFTIELWDSSGSVGPYVWIDSTPDQSIGSITITGTSNFPSVDVTVTGGFSGTVPVVGGRWSYTFTATTAGSYSATAAAGSVSVTDTFLLSPAVVASVTIQPTPDLSSGSAASVTLTGTSTAPFVQLGVTGPGLNITPYITVYGGVWSYNISAGTPGTYNVTATIPGAAASDSFVVTAVSFSVTINPIPDMSAATASAGFTISGTSSSSPITFTISGPGGLNVISGVSAAGGTWSVPVTLPVDGSYTVTAAIPGASATDTFLVTAVSPSYSIVPSSTVVVEGDTVSFNITATNIPNGSLYFWVVSSVTGTITGDDFVGGALSGPLTLNSGVSQTVTRTIRNDGVDEPAEAFQLELRSGSVAGPVVASSGVITINPTLSFNVNSYTVWPGTSTPPPGHVPTNSIPVAVANGSSADFIWFNVTTSGLSLSSGSPMTVTGLAKSGGTPFTHELVLASPPGSPIYPTTNGTFWVRIENYLTIVAGTGPAVPGMYSWNFKHGGTTYVSGQSITITS